jgi:hypothetical protein
MPTHFIFAFGVDTHRFIQKILVMVISMFAIGSLESCASSTITRAPKSMPSAQSPVNKLVIRVVDKPPPLLRGQPFWLRVGNRVQPLMDSLGHTVDIQELLARCPDDVLILYFVFDHEDLAKTRDLARAIGICQDAVHAVQSKSIEVYILITVGPFKGNGSH